MRAAVDTNVLLRALVEDDRKQAAAAAKFLRTAELIAVSLPCLCELVWVLHSVYDFGREEIVEAIESLLDAANVVVNRPAADAGLAVLKATERLRGRDGGWGARRLCRLIRRLWRGLGSRGSWRGF
jgi:predicted nucleic-acid-binding protein